MKRLHAHVGSRNATLQQRPKILKAVGMYAAIHVLSRMVHNLVRVVGCQSLIREQSVSVESRASLHMLANLCLQRTLAAIWNDSSANLFSALHDPHDCGFIFPASSGIPALPLAQVHVPRLPADEGFIYFYFAAIAAELASKEFILQSKADAMQHGPSGFLSHLEIAGYLIAANAILAVGDQPHRSEQLIKADSGIFHHSSNFDGELAFRVMAGASPSASAVAKFHFLRTASGTDDLAVRPAPDCQIVDAVVGIREVDDCFLKALWFAHGLALHEQNHSLNPWSSQLYYYPILGGAGGAGTQVYRGRKKEIPAETELSFKLAEDLQLRPMSRSKSTR